MKITQEDAVQRQTVLHVELEPEDIEKYLDRAYRRAVQQVNVPGFRKGKASRAILERFLGRDVLLSEAMDFLVPDTTSLAIEKQDLETSGSPQVEVEQLDPSVQLKVTVPLAPMVELNNYRDIRLAEERVEVEEERVQETLEQLRREMAPWEPVDRHVELGDMLTLKVKGEVDGRAILDEEDTVYIAEEGNLRPLPGFSQKLVGLPKGQDEEFVLTIPEDYSDSEMAGKECQFHVSVAEIKERKLPELNDEFAKGVGGGYDDLEALRRKVRENLEASAKQDATRRYRDTVVETLVQGAQIELPPLLVEREIDKIITDYQEALKKRQVDMDEYLANVGKTEEQLREEVEAEAVRGLSRSLALAKVVELEGIEVSSEEVESRVEALASGSGDRGQEMRRLFGSDRGRESVRRALLTEKVVDRLVSITSGAAPEPGEPSETQPAAEEVSVQQEEEPQ